MAKWRFVTVFHSPEEPKDIPLAQAGAAAVEKLLPEGAEYTLNNNTLTQV